MRRALWLGSVALTALLVGSCSSGDPASPSPVTNTTLKATAPAVQSPVNGAQLAQGQPVVLTVTNATATTTGLTLSYRFEVLSSTNAVVESAVVAGGSGSTSRTVAAQLDGTYTWHARAESDTLVGPWSATVSFVVPANVGYIRGTELFDPLTNGTTVGTIGGSGNVTFLPGQGIRLNDLRAFVSYQLPQTYSSGEMSVEVSGLAPDGPPGEGKQRIMSMLDRLGSIASSSPYSFNVQYRGAGGAPANCITYKAVLGDNGNSLEVRDRFNNIFNLDPATVYLFSAFWTPTTFRVQVKTGGATGPVLYDETTLAHSPTNWNPAQMFAFLGTNNGSFLEVDGSRIGAIFKNLWVGSTPRPATLP